VANISEYCDPENSLQLITKVQVEPNNTDDAQMLVEGNTDLALADIQDARALLADLSGKVSDF